MSIQKRLLFISTVIFSAAFVLFALIIYFLPGQRILAQIDTDLNTLADEVVRPGNTVLGPGGIIRINIPQDLASFETATTFVMVVNKQGEVVAQSSSLIGMTELLDPNGRSQEKQFNLVYHKETLLRVLTVPLRDANRGEIVGYLQVARLLDNYEEFKGTLFTALLFGSGAALLSVLIAIVVTPRMFRPLEDIATVARQITRADDLSRRVPHTNRSDEIGDLARAFNQTLERLERLFQTQQRLLADVSHELRTPLTAMRGNIDLMRRMGEADPDSLAAIKDEIERMTRLVGDLLLLARVDSGGLPLELKVLELDNILFDVYRQVERIGKSVNVRLTEVDQVHVRGDADRLKQLILNLIDNAIKYTPAGGDVRLSLSKTDGWARVSVSDTGIGIPPDDLPHIFDRFYRVDKARTRAHRGSGSGLGLAIAKWIAQAHGGNINVTSEMEKGTTFSISLPVYKPNEVTKPVPQETPRPSLRLLGSSPE